MNVSEWWELQESSRKRMIVIFGGLAVLMLVLWLIPGKERSTRQEPTVPNRVDILGDDRGQADLQTALSRLRALQDQVDQMKRNNDASQRRIQQLQNALSAATSITGNPEQLAGLVDEVNRMRQEMQELREEGVTGRDSASRTAPVVVLGGEESRAPGTTQPPPITDPFSDAGAPGGDPITSYDPLERIRGSINDRPQAAGRPRDSGLALGRDQRLDRPPAKIIIEDPAPAPTLPGRTAGTRPNQTARDQRGELLDQAPTREVFLPSGSLFEAVLINGMDAPTGGNAARNPYPVAMRVTSAAALPNRFSTNVRECFISGSGFGRLDSERVHIRTENMSCILRDGSVVDIPVEGYITGEDGKVGMRGIVVERTGALIARAALAGVASGLSAAMEPRTRASIQTGGQAGGIDYVTPDVSDVMTVGAMQGVSTAMEKIADWYLERASEIYPIIELDAMRTVTVHLTKGVHLRVRDDAAHSTQLTSGVQ